MREAEFLNGLHLLLNGDVDGLDSGEKITIIRNLCDEYQSRGANNPLPACHIVPFIMGRRPTYEAAHPGLGSSHNASLILDKSAPEASQNKTYILYYLTGLDHYSSEELNAFSLDATIYFTGPDGNQKNRPLPHWNRRPVPFQAFKASGESTPDLVPVKLGEDRHRRFVFSLSAAHDFLPGDAWAWDELDPSIKESATGDNKDPFSFGHLFTQRAYVELRLTRDEKPISGATCWIEICDARRFGSLYQRIKSELLARDTSRQATEEGTESPGHEFHPWYPPLHIGMDKASLYLSALVADIVQDAHLLTDPLWLLRVGRYLEFLTCLGIIEAVKDDVGDLLTAEERAVYETAEAFAPIRSKINPDVWRNVWGMRDISFPRLGAPRTGPVSVANLLAKKKATLAFLRTHHDDLKHAIELAGGCEQNAQESWHRVYRDTERAVLRQSEAAFPELSFLKPSVRDFLLWHRQGKAATMKWLPDQFTAIFGDQDGLFAAACNQYRASMNEVAEWAKKRGLMDYTGQECIPCEASLLQALFDGRGDYIRRLQKADGYGGTPLELCKLPQSVEEAKFQEIYDLLLSVPIFQLLTEGELETLAREARTLVLGPMQRLLVQGREGTSLFIVGGGSLEVMSRQDDGVDLSLAVVERGSVIGEMSLLTGERRSATVRAIEGAVVYEIGKLQYEPLIKSRPSLIEELAKLMEARVRENRQHLAHYDAARETVALGQRIRTVFLGSGPVAKSRP